MKIEDEALFTYLIIRIFLLAGTMFRFIFQRSERGL